MQSGSRKYEKKSDKGPANSGSPSKKSQGSSKPNLPKRKGWDDESDDEDLGNYVQKSELSKSQPFNLQYSPLVSPKTSEIPSKLSQSIVIPKGTLRKDNYRGVYDDDEEEEIIYERKEAADDEKKDTVGQEVKEEITYERKEAATREKKEEIIYERKEPGTHERKEEIIYERKEPVTDEKKEEKNSGRLENERKEDNSDKKERKSETASSQGQGRGKNERKEKRGGNNKKDIQMKENPLRKSNADFEYVVKSPTAPPDTGLPFSKEKTQKRDQKPKNTQEKFIPKVDEPLTESIELPQGKALAPESFPSAGKEINEKDESRIKTQEKPSGNGSIEKETSKADVTPVPRPKNTEEYYIGRLTNIEAMEIRDAFEQLTHNEKMYAYYMSRACWSGSKIAYFQRSYESPALLFLATKIFIFESIEGVKTRLVKFGGWTNEEWEDLLLYFCAFYHNCGNYLTSGSKKFIPRVSRAKFDQFILGSLFAQRQGCMVNHIWNEISQEVFATEAPFQMLGLLEKGGLSGFYTPGITKQEIDFVNEVLIKEKISPLNTRVLKPTSNHFTVLVCSSVFTPFMDRTLVVGDCKVDIFHKDFGMTVNDIVDNLRKAHNFVANENQFRMIGEYIHHFITGNVEAHKNAQRHWLKDAHPTVETNIGFIETYLDPSSTRAEFEGLVALADKKQNQLLEGFVENASNYIKLLPWGEEFERETFLSPNFSMLKYVSFASSAIYDGINIPNYSDITQTEGTKNLQFANVKFEELPSACTREYLDNYLTPEAAEVYWNNNKALKNSRVTLHEVLGHGSGKHLSEDEKGKRNFPEGLLLPNGKPVSSWYKNGQTAGSVFSDLYGAMEECRADCVSIYLSSFDEVLRGLFPQIKEPRVLDDIRYSTWLDICIGGLRSIELFDFQSMQWGQSHRQGWFVITKILLQAGNGLLELRKGADGKTRVHLDRSKILTVGKPALGKFLTVFSPFSP